MEPDSAWFTPGFDDSSWAEDVAVAGYGYGNTGYVSIDSTAKSLYARFTLKISEKEKIKKLNFLVDYDDGYIAYLNGVEIARVNIDKSIIYPPYDAVATRSHSAEFFVGITSPILGIYLDSAFLATTLVNGDNIFAVHIVNDSVGNDLMFLPSIMNLTTIPEKDDRYFARFDSRCKKLIEIDSTNLPLVVIETDPNGIAYDKTIWTSARMGIINNGEGKFNKPSDPYNEYNGSIAIKLRGQSSRDFAKQTYRIELNDENANDTSVILMGMPAESDWILSGPFTDKSQIRNKFAYDLAARMGHYSPRSRFCELILNGQLVGLYTLTEEIKRDKNRVDISKLLETDIAGDDVTGGYIFKFDKTPPRGTTIIKGREMVYPSELTAEQKYYMTRFLTVYDSILMKTNDFTDPVKGFRKYASDSSLADFFVINEITKNPDVYIYSTYMYKDRNDKDGRMKFGPVWDFDLAFGNTYFQEGNKTTGWQFVVNQATMRTTRYFQDTEFVELFQNRYHELRAKTYSNDSILDYFDGLLEQVRLARERNYLVWPVIDQAIFYPGYYIDSYENEVAYMRDWIIKRLEWLDNNVDLIYYPLVRVGNEQIQAISGNLNLRVFPNPFENELMIDFNLEKVGDVQLELYNFSGQLQLKEVVGEVDGYHQVVLNSDKISSLKQGIYVAKLIVDNVPVQSIKVIKR
jgi:hypothetical protein